MDPTLLALKLELLEKEAEIIRMRQQIHMQQTTPVVPVTPTVTTPVVCENPIAHEAIHVWDEDFEVKRETVSIELSDVSVKFTSEGKKRHFKRINMKLTNLKSRFIWDAGYGWSIEKHGDNIYSTGGTPLRKLENGCVFQQGGLGVYKLKKNPQKSSPKTHIWDLIYDEKSDTGLGILQNHLRKKYGAEDNRIGAKMIQDVVDNMDFN